MEVNYRNCSQIRHVSFSIKSIAQPLHRIKCVTRAKFFFLFIKGEYFGSFFLFHTFLFVRSTILLNNRPLGTIHMPCKIQVLLSGDMEGIFGIHRQEMVSPAPHDSVFYERCRRLNTNEINAVVREVYRGIEKYRRRNRSRHYHNLLFDDDDEKCVVVIVADGHAYSINIVMEILDTRARVAARMEDNMILSGIRGKFFENGRSSRIGMDSNQSEYPMVERFCLFIRYHGMALIVECDDPSMRPPSFLAHTKSGLWIRQVQMNGQPVSEGIINALLAQLFGSKAIFISGTDVGVHEVLQKIPTISSLVCIKSRSASNGINVYVAQWF